MKVLIKNAQIICPGSTFHNKKKDVLVSNGTIVEIGDNLGPGTKTIDGKNLVVTPGWFDMCANFSDPGNEQKEDVFSGSAAAAAGGFTGVALLPNTNPSIQTKNDIGYVLSKSKKVLPDIYTYGSVTKDNHGEELTEMLDQQAAGAIAFTDGEKPIWNTDILLKALQYARKFDGLIINKPEDTWLNMLGQMHEGITSTSLGLKGMPSIAEEVMIDRDTRILEYTGGKLHFSNISTAGAVKLIKKAKKAGLDITCDVAAHQLFFTEIDLADFDTNLKVNPPLRTEKDRIALIRGIEDGTIDVIVSAHKAHDEECKKLEFDHADFGMTAVQTVLPILLEVFGEKGFETFIDKVVTNPRKRLGIPSPVIDIHQPANLIVIDKKREWQLNDKTNLSKSVNSPFWGKPLKGKVLACFNGSNSYFDESL